MKYAIPHVVTRHSIAPCRGLLKHLKHIQKYTKMYKHTLISILKAHLHNLHIFPFFMYKITKNYSSAVPNLLYIFHKFIFLLSHLAYLKCYIYGYVNTTRYSLVFFYVFYHLRGLSAKCRLTTLSIHYQLLATDGYVKGCPTASRFACPLTYPDLL